MRVENIDENGGIAWKSSKYISQRDYEILKRYELFNNELIISIAGSIGRSAKFQINDPLTKAILTENCAKIEVTSESLTSEYLGLLLQSEIIQRQIQKAYIQTTIPKLGLGRIESLKIPPLPSLTKQGNLVDAFQAAVAKKRKQEADAQAILDGIDGYLLGELGITLPHEPANIIENRMFKIARQEVSGGRFDPTFQKVVTEFTSTLYPSALLREHVWINPLTAFKNLTDEDEITFVPMENVSEDGYVDTTSARIIGECKGYTTFAENDLIVAKITPCMENGKSSVVRNLLNGYGFGSTEFHVFRAKSGLLNIDFLHAFLHAEFFRRNAKMMFGGSAGHQRVPPEFFKKMRIPVPSLEEQERIVAEITSRQQQAFALRQQAQQDFTAAKAEIERLILG